MTRHGYTQPAGWQRTRARILRRDPTCRLGYDGCTNTSTTVDHVVPVSVRPDHTDANLAGCCQPCHDVKSERERLAGMARRHPQQHQRRHPFGDLDHNEDERHVFRP